MSHWAKIDENNVVIQVTVGNNDDANEGYDWLIENLGGTWLKTSYNTKNGEHLNGGEPFRGNYAGVGFVYDEELDAFIPPKPEPTEEVSDWVLNEETFSWEPAI